ncbi:hypothetical protein CUMW_055960 [Citrus unshiu]|nr:hypothetical protein CUMW_055960 [Citrus unshiu]
MVRETEDKGSLETYNIHHDNLDHLLTVCLVQSLILIFSPTKPRSRIESSNRKLMIWELGPEKSCDQSLHSQHGAGPAAERGLLVAGCSLEGFIVLMCYKPHRIRSNSLLHSPEKLIRMVRSLPKRR